MPWSNQMNLGYKQMLAFVIIITIGVLIHKDNVHQSQIKSFTDKNAQKPQVENSSTLAADDETEVITFAVPSMLLAIAGLIMWKGILPNMRICRELGTGPSLDPKEIINEIDNLITGATTQLDEMERLCAEESKMRNFIKITRAQIRDVLTKHVQTMDVKQRVIHALETFLSKEEAPEDEFDVFDVKKTLHKHKPRNAKIFLASFIFQVVLFCIFGVMYLVSVYQCLSYSGKQLKKNGLSTYFKPIEYFAISLITLVDVYMRQIRGVISLAMTITAGVLFAMITLIAAYHIPFSGIWTCMSPMADMAFRGTCMGVRQAIGLM